MDILLIVGQVTQIIALVVGIGAFRYLTDEGQRREGLFSDKIRRLEQAINGQAMVLNELKSVCQQNKSSDNHDLILKVLEFQQTILQQNIKQEPVKTQELPKSESKSESKSKPKRTRADSKEMEKVWTDLVGIK